MTVSTVTIPPVPGCLVMVADPSSSTSAMGKPTSSRPGTSVKKLKFPPVAWAPHSMTCPATTAPANRFQS